MKRIIKLILLFCVIFFAGQWIKSDPFRIVGAAFIFLICSICATFYLIISTGVINDMFYRFWRVIKKWFYFSLTLIIVFIPLILGFVFHVKKWWLWVLIGVVQIVFIISGIVIFGGLVSNRALNNSDGY